MADITIMTDKGQRNMVLDSRWLGYTVKSEEIKLERLEGSVSPIEQPMHFSPYSQAGLDG
jgi:hypothetical protein